MKWIVEAETLEDMLNDNYNIAVLLTECKNCTHRNGDYCHRFHDGYSAFIHHDDYCSYAERRTDEADYRKE